VKRYFIGIAFVLLFGVARLPFESTLSEEQQAAGFHTASLDLELREQVGQLSFLAALSGFRSLVAALIYIDAHVAWENTEWGKMIGHFNTVTTLQPRSELYWDMAGWHAAYNAGASALQDKSEPSEILRQRNADQYVQVGRDFLERGTKNLPESYILPKSLGQLLREKAEDHCAAADAFALAAAKPNAPAYLERFVAYELSECPGREQEAYDLLVDLYHRGEDQRTLSLIRIIRELEEELNVPPDQRIQEK